MDPEYHSKYAELQLGTKTELDHHSEDTHPDDVSERTTKATPYTKSQDLKMARESIIPPYRPGPQSIPLIAKSHDPPIKYFPIPKVPSGFWRVDHNLSEYPNGVAVLLIKWADDLDELKTRNEVLLQTSIKNQYSMTRSNNS
jgi:hypothetical protein